MPKWAKCIAAIFLIPLCLGATKALGKVVQATGPADQVWVLLGCGAGCWLVVFMFLPKPVWLYVVGHEFTHALWTWLLGGKVKAIKATSRGGYVVVTTRHFLVDLAPYFFPFYASAITIMYGLGNLWIDLEPLRIWFYFLVGGAYAFHVTFTGHVLRIGQSDLSNQGYFFSLTVIWLGNAAVLLVSLPLLTGQITSWLALRWFGLETMEVLRTIHRLLQSWWNFY